MKCAWNELLSILPNWMRSNVDKLGRTDLLELRMREGMPPQLVLKDRQIWMECPISENDLNFCVNAASRYSPWSASTIAQGYLTAPGGHRIGLCGEAVLQNNRMTGIRHITSLCIRIARDFPGISEGIPVKTGSVLILGRPGSGKTTLLRDLIRKRSNLGQACISVIDERGELFPHGLHDCGKRTDILTGCSKQEGIDMVLRTMGPGCIAVDEITAQSDAEALLKACWCGVDILATAHAGSYSDFLQRPIYHPFTEKNIFQTVLVMREDKSWKVERREI